MQQQHFDEASECAAHIASATLPTHYGTFASHVFRVRGDGTEHLALVMGRCARARRCSHGCIRSA